MSQTWYLVIIVVGAFVLLYPKDAEMTTVYMELQLRKLWLFLRIYPQFVFLRWRMKFMAWRILHNKTTNTKTE